MRQESQKPMNELRFTEGHVWVRSEPDGAIAIGITPYAQDQLGDVVFVELPEPGRILKQGETAAVIESVKTADEITAPFNGSVVAVNPLLVEAPETVNRDPMGDGWFFRMRPEGLDLIEGLMDQETYESYITGL